MVFSILGFMVLITLIVGVALFCYYLIYANHINKKIQNGQASNREMIDIPKVIMIAVIVLLLSYTIIISYNATESYKNASIVNRDDAVIVDLSDYTICMYTGERTTDSADFAKAYSKEANAGYKKTVEQDGDFVFTTFIRTDEADDFHPDFLCFVDYTGEENSVWSLYKETDYIDNISGTVTGLSSGGDIQTNLLYIGNLNDGESFQITQGVLNAAAEREYSNAQDTADKSEPGEIPSFADYALSSGSTLITME
jgi:hypothetical protein